MAVQWAIDFGSTNTVAALAEEGAARVVHLPELSRLLPTDQSPLIPSAVYVQEGVRRRFFPSWLRRRKALIGQPALSRNFDGRAPGYAEGFKRHLSTQPHRALARVGAREVSAREAAHLFLEGLLAALRREHRQRIVDLTIPSPVGFYEQYRAELQSLARRLGIRRFRSLDEPVAAALGYGLDVERAQTLLVMDFGGGTLNLAAVRLGAPSSESGAAPVLAKSMVALGGEDVDRWIAESLVPAPLRELPEWERDLRWEAMFLKERVSREGHGEFRWRGLQHALTRDDLTRILAERGLYTRLRAALADVDAQLRTEVGGLAAEVAEVLLTGGSTLLPGVAAVVDEAHPGAVVRHDPGSVFTAVALGAARFAGGVAVEDWVYHDYALAVQNERTQTVEYELLVPRRTRYPTPAAYGVRYYADYAGMAEMRFSLCEVGRLGEARVAWESRPNGGSYWAPRTPEERALVVELNPGEDPVPLRPAGAGASPRLRVTYGVNANRWLCITVEDLVRKQVLRLEEPVARLR